MKTSLFIVFILMTAIESFAQGDQKLLFAKKAKGYQRMKTAGTVLSIAGSVSMVVALVTFTDEDGDNTVSTTAAIIGATSMGTGIPLWVVGAHNQYKYQKLRDLSVRVNMNPGSRGITLRYRF